MYFINTQHLATFVVIIFVVVVVVVVVNDVVPHLETTTVAHRDTGSQGTNIFHLLLADFHYCHYRKLKEMT